MPKSKAVSADSAEWPVTVYMAAESGVEELECATPEELADALANGWRLETQPSNMTKLSLG